MGAMRYMGTPWGLMVPHGALAGQPTGSIDPNWIRRARLRLPLAAFLP